jgi:hypothetical protein
MWRDILFTEMAGKKAKKAKKGGAQKQLFSELRAQRQRREKLLRRVEEERLKLSELLVAGVASGAAVSDLAAEAGISRIHAYRVLSLAQPRPATAGDGAHVDAAATHTDSAKPHDPAGEPSSTASP